MVKEQFQQELNEKIRPGVKPSTLKKLKRSKSEGDIPASPSNQEKQITQLQEQVKFHSKTAANYLKSLQISQAKVSELEEKLKNNPPSQLAELDQSLSARHRNLKDWFKEYQKNKKLDQELAENIDEASTELVEQDKVINKLQGEVSKLKNEKESLQKDLKLASRLAEVRKVPYFANENNYDYLKYALYSLGAVLFTIWLVKYWKTEENHQ